MEAKIWHFPRGALNLKKLRTTVLHFSLEKLIEVREAVLNITCHHMNCLFDL